MKGIFMLILSATMIANADAQVFKCKDENGVTTYSQTPCSNGDSQILNISNGTSGSTESSEAVIERNLRAAEIMEQRRLSSASNSKPQVTIIRDSGRPVTTSEILREKMERKRILAEQGIEESGSKRIFMSCNRAGSYTYCNGNDGSSLTTVNMGSTSTTIINK